jgi:hypothetical protein
MAFSIYDREKLDSLSVGIFFIGFNSQFIYHLIENSTLSKTT